MFLANQWFIFLIFTSVAPHRGQPAVKCHPRWQPTRRLAVSCGLGRHRIRTRDCRTTVWHATIKLPRLPTIELPRLPTIELPRLPTIELPRLPTWATTPPYCWATTPPYIVRHLCSWPTLQTVDWGVRQGVNRPPNVIIIKLFVNNVSLLGRGGANSLLCSVQCSEWEG